jgi:AraC-like DNA-binding protein
VYGQKRGQTPAKAVEAIRLDAARRRLEETDDRIEVIAEDCGYSGEERMQAARTTWSDTAIFELHATIAIQTGRRQPRPEPQKRHAT